MFTNFGRLGKLVVLLAFRRSKRERGRLPALPSAVRVERDRQGAKKERKDNLKKKNHFGQISCLKSSGFNTSDA